MSKSIFREKRSKRLWPSLENWSTSWSDPVILFCMLGLVLVSGCGYHLTARMPYVLPEGITTLYLAEVNNPTTNSFLEPGLRNEFRDELNRRGDIQWVPEQKAQAKIVLNILSFRSGGKLESAGETTIRSEVVLRLEARLYSSRTGGLLSRTGTIVARESFGSQDVAAENTAQDRVVELAAELAAQRLNQAF